MPPPVQRMDSGSVGEVPTAAPSSAGVPQDACTSEMSAATPRRPERTVAPSLKYSADYILTVQSWITGPGQAHIAPPRPPSPVLPGPSEGFRRLQGRVRAPQWHHPRVRRWIWLA